MKLGILLTSGLESEDAYTVRQLALAALRQGHQVAIFLMDDGVYNTSRLRELTGQGASIAVCTHNAHQRQVEKVEGLLFGGLNDWAEIVKNADRVVVFG